MTELETYSEMRDKIAALTQHNARLSDSLRKARGQLIELRSDLERISQPPNSYGTVLEASEPGTALILHNQHKLRVQVSSEVPAAAIVPGAEVMLSENLVVVAAFESSELGSLASVLESVSDTQVLVRNAANDERVVRLGTNLAETRIQPGDRVVLDRSGRIALLRLQQETVSELTLEAIPDVTYAQIGGLQREISEIRDAVELPFLQPELFAEHGLTAPKGVLLYGPPGCGKTLIAKAVAHELSVKMGRGEDADASRSNTPGGYFLNVKGPELLNKFVGETERAIRKVFADAREKASQGYPVVVFFDEMESVFRTRGSGISSDTESTIVPQLLTELDGVEKLDNVIVIGASNREDMIDPALLRPGRLDVKIRISRPDRASATEILGLYLTPDLPWIDSREAVIDAGIEQIFVRNNETAYAELLLADDSRVTLFFSDFISGATLRNIADRAKKAAVKDFLDQRANKGLRIAHIRQAVLAEIRENEDVPALAHADEWLRVAGHRDVRVKEIIPLHALRGE